MVDEASLASTFALDELMSAALDARAKVVLVGDGAQLSSVDAGGMFRTLVRERGEDAPTLADVRRFKAAWEKEASLGVRRGTSRGSRHLRERTGGSRTAPVTTCSTRSTTRGRSTPTVACTR